MNAYLCLNNKHRWPGHRESIPVKNFIGLKPQMFSPGNLFPFTVLILVIIKKFAKSHIGSFNSFEDNKASIHSITISQTA